MKKEIMSTVLYVNLHMLRGNLNVPSYFRNFEIGSTEVDKGYSTKKLTVSSIFFYILIIIRNS